MPNNLTDAEIKKALEICASEHLGCEDGCPLKGTNCRFEMPKYALDLINRQDFRIMQLEKTNMEIQNANLIDFKSTIGNYMAEIERLREENEIKSSKRANIFEIVNALERGKAEALKEAASKFAGHSDYHGDTILCTLYCMAEGNEVGNAKPLDKSEIKAEAYKEAFEKVKNIILPQLTSSTLEKKEAYYFCLNVLDNLLNKLVGDKI